MAFFPSNDEARTLDPAELGRGSGRDSEPTAIELKPPTPIGLLPDGVTCDVSSKGFQDVLRGGYESKTSDGLFLCCVGSGQGESQSGHSPRAFGGSSGRVNQDDLLGLGETTGVIHGDLSPHGMAHQGQLMGSQVVAEEFQVQIEGAHLEVFWVRGVSMSAKIQAHDMVMRGKKWRNVVPPVRIGTSAMKEHHQGAAGLAPLQGMQPEGSAFEVFGARRVGGHVETQGVFPS